jgi:NAD(P)-dependent dehydrogenase (short-subunit alcohol dehydrogenase family)
MEPYNISERLRGKSAIITGGASGIGAALGRALARQGADVVLADRQLALAEEVAATIRRDGGRATASELDVRELAAHERVVAQTVERCGHVDLYFNNAGIQVAGEIERYQPEDWDDVFDVNLLGVAYGVQAVYPIMIRQRAGHIVNTSSLAGLVALPGEASYTASKHAVMGLSKSLRLEAKQHGVRVSVLCPGAIRTPIFTGGKFGRMRLSNQYQQEILRMIEYARPMHADRFAERALDAVLAGEFLIMLPRWWRAVWYLDRFAPTLIARVWEPFLSHMRAQHR